MQLALPKRRWLVIPVLGTALLAGCGGVSGGGGESGNTVGTDVITGTTPADQATSVATSAVIRITFAKPAVPGTEEGGVVAGGAEVEIATNWSDDNTVLSVTPAAPWQNGLTYTVRFTAVTFADGTELATAYSFSFTVGEGGDGTVVAGKWALWTGGTRLRGANIWQSRNYVELHGEGTLGDGPVGPPFAQGDFDALAAFGANYVNISHPGLFTEAPPYELDESIQANLDDLLDKIAQADMFAVITFRTGPGRSEFWAVLGEDTEASPAEGWFDPSYYNHTVWQEQAAKDAWAAMWRHTAERYRGNAVVVGYDLMCEPNAEEIFFDIWGQPDDFYPAQANTSYDWNVFYPAVVDAIREVDAETPILVQPMGYGSVAWLPYLELTDDTRTVYTIHQYEPSVYTHQAPPPDNTYPGEFDTDYDEVGDEVNRAWLNSLLETVDEYATTHDVPIAVNEFGLMRWEPGGDQFMTDIMNLFEQRGMNHALWAWSASWEPFAWNDGFNFRNGLDPENHKDAMPNDLADAISENWRLNTLRPSNVMFDD